MMSRMTVRTRDDHFVEIDAEVAQRFVAVDASEQMRRVRRGVADTLACLFVNVSLAAMMNVLEFCRMQDATPVPIIKKPISSNVMSDILPEPYVTYMDNLSVAQLCELASAAECLGFDVLLDLCVVKITTLIKDRSAPEILQTFGLAEQRSDHL